MLNATTIIDIASKLRDLASYVEHTVIESVHDVSITFDEIRRGYPIEALSDLKAWSSPKSSYIYQFSIEGEGCKELHNAFKLAKGSRRNDRAYCRLNAASALLYVGSSSDLDSRVKQHLGYGNKATYAMQLCHWLPTDEGVLRLQAWRFSKDTNGAIVQAIEDGLWGANKPMFGRQGAR